MNGRLRSTTAMRAHGKSSAPRIITLLTDFGSADYFVGAMKGVILSLAPDVRLVDITHEIPAQDIRSGAFNILAAHDAFPKGTIHLCVVDPGVGSERRAIAIHAAGQFFVGPDNGLFSYICERSQAHRIVEITNKKLFRRPMSKTFHARDVFAPVAANLAMGIELSNLGREVDDYVSLGPLKPVVAGPRRLQGQIIHVDRFGNCVTNFTSEQLPAQAITRFQLMVKRKNIRNLKGFYAEEPVKSGELFAIWGSAGFLEIAATNASAARILKARTGDAVWLQSL